MTEIYTVSFTVPHVPTEDEMRRKAKYESELAAYNALLATGPCGAPKMLVKKVSKVASAK